MTKIEKRRLGVLIGFLAIAIILIVIIVNAINGGKNNKVDNNNNKPNNEVVDNNKENSNNNKPGTLEQYEENKNDSMDIKGTENVNKNGDTITNKSNALNGVKKVANVEISNLKVVYNAGTTKITGTIANKTDKDIDVDFVNMNIVDNSGKTVKTINLYIGKVKAGSNKQLDAETQADISNLKDITFTK